MNDDENASSPDPAPGAPPSPDEIEGLRTRAKAADDLARERDDFKNRYLRALADFDNYQKRARREQERYREEALRDLLKDLTVTVDDLNRAIPSLDEKEAGLGKPVAVVRDQLLQLLRQRGVAPLGTKPGEPFDPDRHEAVMMVPGEGLTKDEVGLVLREGWKLGATILRPAAVQVKKQAAPSAPPAGEGAQA